MPTCTDCDALSFTIMLDDTDGSAAELSDGFVASWVYGFQGGTMIVPWLLFDAGSVVEGELVRVELTHSPDPADPDAFGEVADFTSLSLELEVQRDAEGRLVTSLIEDQIGWTDLDGTRLTMSATVRRGDDVAMHSGTILLMNPSSPCDVFESSDSGCGYHHIPGTVTVSVGDASDACTEGRTIELAFQANDPEAAAACLETRGSIFNPELTFERTASSACIEELGLTDGTFGATLDVIYSGGCVPGNLRLDGDLEARCDALCSP